MANRWSPTYYSKKEILCMDNVQLLNALYTSARDETKAQNFRDHIPAQLLKQTDWIREEILSRFR